MKILKMFFFPMTYYTRHRCGWMKQNFIHIAVDSSYDLKGNLCLIR